MAASVCTEKSVNPREVYENYFSELEKMMKTGIGNASLPKIQNYNLGRTLMKTK